MNLSFMFTKAMLFLSTVAAVDYRATTLDFTVGPGISRLCINVTIVDDDILERVEIYFADLGATRNSRQNFLTTIVIMEDPTDSKNYSTGL